MGAVALVERRRSMQKKTLVWLLASSGLLAFAGCCSGPEPRVSTYPPQPCNRCGNNGPLPPRFTPTPTPAPGTNLNPALLPPVETQPPSNYYSPPNYSPPPNQ